MATLESSADAEKKRIKRNIQFTKASFAHSRLTPPVLLNQTSLKCNLYENEWQTFVHTDHGTVSINSHVIINGEKHGKANDGHK